MRRDDYENELKSQPNETKAESTKRYQANSFVNKDGTEAKATAAHSVSSSPAHNPFRRAKFPLLFLLPRKPPGHLELAFHPTCRK